MKTKLLMILTIGALLMLGGCRGDAEDVNGNLANATMNTNMVNAGTPAPVTDEAAKSAVEAAIKKKGIEGVEVEATTEKITLRGTVEAGKMSEAVMAAQEVANRPVVNQLGEKK